MEDIKRFCSRNKAVKLSSRHRSGNLRDMGHSWLVLVLFALVSCKEAKDSFESVVLCNKASTETSKWGLSDLASEWSFCEIRKRHNAYQKFKVRRNWFVRFRFQVFWWQKLQVFQSSRCVCCPFTANQGRYLMQLHTYYIYIYLHDIYHSFLLFLHCINCCSAHYSFFQFDFGR